MYRQGVSTAGENQLRTHQSLKPTDYGSAKRKLNALGDLKNTLHCRPASVNYENTAKLKLTPFPKHDFLKPSSTVQKSGKKNKNKIYLRTPPSSDEDEDEVDFKCKNHFLCEDADKALLEKFLSEFKLSKEEILKIANRVGNLTPEIVHNSSCFNERPIATDIYVETTIKKEKSFTLNDVLKDLSPPPPVPPPVGLF